MEEDGPTGVVMIARDNITRDQLNTAARTRLRDEDRLPVEGVTIGERDWSVGDRVIARRNDRRLDVDNGTMGTITAVLPDGAGLKFRTDSGQERVLDGAYVSQHLEHAYAITGHSSQGATVEAAIVVGRPEEFTREWAYTALSRARGETTLELITGDGPIGMERSEYAPVPPVHEPADALDVLARAMRRSEKEDLALEQAGPNKLTGLAEEHDQPLRRLPRGLKPGWAAREPAFGHTKPKWICIAASAVRRVTSITGCLLSTPQGLLEVRITALASESEPAWSIPSRPFARPAAVRPAWSRSSDRSPAGTAPPASWQTLGCVGRRRRPVERQLATRCLEVGVLVHEVSALALYGPTVATPRRGPCRFPDCRSAPKAATLPAGQPGAR